MRSTWIYILLISAVAFAGYLYLTGHFTQHGTQNVIASKEVSQASNRDSKTVDRKSVTAPVLAKQSPKPEYPDSAIAQHEEGQVVLNLYVGKDGHVKDAKILHSSGSAHLDQAAMNTARGDWRYEPATANGKPVAMWHKLKVTFTCTADGQDNCRDDSTMNWYHAASR